MTQLPLANSLAWMLIAVSTSWAAPADVPPVKTLADLEACAPLDAGGEWSVRLGYGEPLEDAGAPWLVLYCLAEFTGKADEEPVARRRTVRGEMLGPVSYTWERANPRQKRAMLNQEVSFQSKPPRRLLYCATLPANDDAAMRLGVCADDGRELAARTLDARKRPPTCYWHTFASIAYNGRGFPAFVARRADAAYPKFGAMPLAAPEPTDAPPPPAAQPSAVSLPGLSGAGDAEGLRLSLEEGEFVIAADRFMTDWPDYYLLARWWVNGEPVVARVSDRPLAQKAARQVSSTEEMRVAFGLPDQLPPLKAGDRVTLQVLYAPDGIERFQPPGQDMKMVRHAMSRLGDDDVARPLLSNRLEFEMTEALMRLVDPKPAED